MQQLAALYLTPVARALAPRRLCLVVAAWALCAESILVGMCEELLAVVYQEAAQIVQQRPFALEDRVQNCSRS